MLDLTGFDCVLLMLLMSKSAVKIERSRLNSFVLINISGKSNTTRLKFPSSTKDKNPEVNVPLLEFVGRHVTIVSHSKCVQTALDAASELEKEDIECEVRLSILYCL